MTDCSEKDLCNIAVTKFEELEKRWAIQYDALEAAIIKSEQILNTRLEEMNNFRKQILDERQSFTTRRETVLLNFVISILLIIAGIVITLYGTKIL